jgi:hypothetical protein
MHPSNDDDESVPDGNSSCFWHRAQKPMQLQRILHENGSSGRPQAARSGGHSRDSPPSPKFSSADKENVPASGRSKNAEQNRCAHFLLNFGRICIHLVQIVKSTGKSKSNFSFSKGSQNCFFFVFVQGGGGTGTGIR